MLKEIKTAGKILLFLTLLTGVIYPLSVTLVAQTIFPEQANGSLIRQANAGSGSTIIGSKLIAQKFVQEKYFWSRPSATDYSAMPSGGSNFSPIAKNLKTAVDERRAFLNGDLSKDEAAKKQAPPSDLLFTSASGLDPHISPEAVYFQVERVARARQWDDEKKQKISQLIRVHIEKRQWGFLGEKRVNVLELNRALDSI